MAQESILLNNGRRMPTIALGTAEAENEAGRQSLRIALEYGYRSFDTAFFYNNERFLGYELEEWLNSGRVKRDDLYVTTKLPLFANRPMDVRKYITLSLKNLRLDYVDQYLVHHPFGLHETTLDNKFARGPDGYSRVDYDTDMLAVWKAMEDEVFAGRTKAIGLSNFNAEQIDRIMKVARIPPAMLQVELHVYLQQPSLIECCKKYGIAVSAYSPIGAPYTPEGRAFDPPLLSHPLIKKIGDNHKKTTAQVMLQFLRQLGLVILPKSVNPERIKSNFDLNFTLTQEEMEQLKKLDRGEAGRIYHFRDVFKGCDKHKEYPF